MPLTSNKLFLFDIDGTLLNIQKGFMHRLIETILKEYTHRNIDLSRHRFAGRTDRDIFYSILDLELQRSDDHLFEQVKSAYIERLSMELTQEHVTLIEHVEEVIFYLKKEGIPFGLLTGNFRESAYIKLNRVHIDQYFTFGAFGTHHIDRNKLPEIALIEARKIFNIDFKPEDMIIIGDTPKDIACAQHFGSVSLAVATGYYTTAELAEHNPDYLLDNLSEFKQTLNV